MDWNCTATCVGSLPHTDPVAAVDLIVSRPALIPFWPQLPARGFRENMYAQYASRLPGMQMDEGSQRLTVDLDDYDPLEFYTMMLSEELDWFAMPEALFSGYYELIERDLGYATFIKGQVTGPVSEGLQILDRKGKPVLYDASYSEIVRRNLNMMARWQQRQLSALCPNTIMFLDEPSLSLMGTPFASFSSVDATRWMDETLEGVEGYTAIHCCGNTDWPTVLASSIDILSFDAYSYGHTIALFPEELSAFLERGGSLAWGLVPNTQEALAIEDADNLVRLYEIHISSLVVKGMDEDLLRRRTLVTPQCGLGGLSVAETGSVLDMLVQVSDLLGERLGA